MAFQPYVPPEQLMKDRSDYARKGIARGKSVLAFETGEGIVFVAENPSATLHKISEIYDRIAFAGVGKYSEFESLRIGGVQLADMRGYSYGREDVTAKTLANAYSQALSAIFTQQMKPYEVELLVAQVGHEPARDEMYHIGFDGSVTDQEGFVAMGGSSDELSTHLKDRYRADLEIAEAVALGIDALGTVEGRPMTPDNLEAAVLDRARPRRTFRRLSEADLASLAPSAS